MRSSLALACALSVALIPGCGRQPPSAAQNADEVRTLDVTSWTAHTELFMEHPPLVAGETVRFAVHLTNLSDFKAVEAGRPAIELTPEAGGLPVRLAGSGSLRPGVFRIEGTLPSAGRYRWALLLSAPGVSDRHDLGTTVVFGDAASAAADAATRATDDATAIAYLKEQQWTNPFATIVVRERDVRASVRAPATVEPVTGGDATVVAPAPGRYLANTLPSVGDRVVARQELGRLEPRLSGVEARASLAAAVTEAQTASDAARAELVRAERLLLERAVPARRVEDARRAVAVAEARATAARASLAQRDEVLREGGGAASGNAFMLRAPIAGLIAEVLAVSGASYDEGAQLFRVIRADRVALLAQVPPVDVGAARALISVAFEVPGQADPIELTLLRVHDAGVVDPRTRALPLRIDVDNQGRHLLVGQAGTAVLRTGSARRLPAVPVDAVLTEGGRPYVFVQLGGERFARRQVDVASSEAGMVAILAGVRSGERVVTRGAYDVQLASASRGLAAEGHVH